MIEYLRKRKAKKQFALESARHQIALRYRELLDLGSSPGHCAFDINGIQHRGRRGTKAWISDADRQDFDSFFWWVHNLQVGEMVIVVWGQGYGQHTGKDGVVYIGQEDPPEHGIAGRLSAHDVQVALEYYRTH
jgi:hypothetical protein